MTQPSRTALLALDEDRSIEVHQRRSARAKRLILRVDAARNRVELVLPPRLSEARAWSFLESKRDWLTARLAEIPDTVPFAPGQVVPLRGLDHVIRHHAGTIRGRRPIWVAPGQLSLIPENGDGHHALPAIHVSGAEAHLSRRLMDWLKGEARRELSDRTREKARQLGKRVARVTVRDPRSRWGSCSAEGRIAYSWRLILAPEPVLDYVVAHEVAHLVELNHSTRFWRLVDQLTPEVDGPKAWLRSHGSGLHQYGDTPG